MSDDSTDKEMQELLQKRVDLLKEKEELLKERQMIANQSKQGAAPTAQRPKEPSVAPSKRAEDLMSAVNGNIFQGGDTGAKKTSNKKKEDDEAGFFGRRGFLRTLLVTFGFSVLTLVSAFILSYPRLEKLAYVQFGALFENGAITLRKQLKQAIEAEKWDTVEELCEEDGVLEQQLIQPMMFFATTSVDDTKDREAFSYVAAVQETLVGAQASIDLIYEAAENKDKPAALRGLEALKSRANSFVRLANQRMPDDTIPLSEIK